eukprot:CAMPEP_0194375482 /NCGR_PEP_ID=MMETSP0174-20130528/24025_1 /TAXON_ID=216777 /ORGANISM="Proboscia alata, Strain PI-D3" /LENGTH=355 /DNA_ID=CAMNT_0039155729 /DNA_START=65 /DNA_END=1129 /DNA_ORIENTATION=+
MIKQTQVSDVSFEPIEFSIKGVYAQVPRKEENYPSRQQVTTLSNDKVMVRRRMNTRPFDPKELIGKNNGSLHEKLALKLKNDQDRYEVARFEPVTGLVGSEFFHVKHLGKSDNQIPAHEDRAILFQSLENYQKLSAEPTLSRFFTNKFISVKEQNDIKNSKNMGKSLNNKTNNNSSNVSNIVNSILDNPLFGENVIVSGVSSYHISNGDIFEMKGGCSTLKIEVTSPRLPCVLVDKRNGSLCGMKGVKRYASTYGLAGWFTRVLEAGELENGMVLVRTSSPHPKWTLEYISMALYGEGSERFMSRNWASWARDVGELRELCSLKQLAKYEWYNEAQYILDKWSWYENHATKNKLW